MNSIVQIRVFATDDHPIVTTGLTILLKNPTHIELVGTAHSTKEMFHLIPKTRPNVLILDLNLPGSDFYENIAKLKEQFPWIKILIYSSYYTPELVKSLLNAGVQGYLIKSSHPKEIITAIEMIYKGEVYVNFSPKNGLKTISKEHQSEQKASDDFQKRLRLSRREQEILTLISRGFTSQLIGETLFISKHTVETHRKNILRKLDFGSSAELVKFAVQQGLV